MKRAAPQSTLKKHIKESPELQKLRTKRKRERNRTITIVSVVSVLLVVGIVLASRIPKLQIVSVSVSGNQVIATDKVLEVVDRHLSGNYLYVIPHRNAILYPRRAILRDLRATFPRFAAISLNRVGFKKLEISVTEGRGNALWCGLAIEPVDFRAPCYFTDESGTIIDHAPYYSGDVYLRFYGGVPLVSENPIGQQFLPQNAFQNLLAFARGVADLGFPVKAVRIGPGEEDALLIEQGGATPVLLRFKAAADYNVLLANFTATIRKREVAEELATKRDKLEYFDMRFSNKVYFKFADDGN